MNCRDGGGRKTINYGDDGTEGSSYASVDYEKKENKSLKDYKIVNALSNKSKQDGYEIKGIIADTLKNIKSGRTIEILKAEQIKKSNMLRAKKESSNGGYVTENKDEIDYFEKRKCEKLSELCKHKADVDELCCCGNGRDNEDEGEDDEDEDKKNDDDEANYALRHKNGLEVLDAQNDDSKQATQASYNCKGKSAMKNYDFHEINDSRKRLASDDGSLSSWKKNVYMVFGKFWYLNLFLPIHYLFPTPENGVEWPKIEGCVKVKEKSV